LTIAVYSCPFQVRVRSGRSLVLSPLLPQHQTFDATDWMAAARHSDADEWPSFVPEERPIIRALTPQSAQTISLSGPILKPCDRLLIVVSRFPVSFSSHVAEPFSEHSGHVTDVTNRSRLATTASWMERRLTLNTPVGSHPPLRVPTARMLVGAPGPGLGEVVAAEHEGRARPNLWN
jgi:hypothetical protein